MSAHQRLLSIITALVMTAGASSAADAKPLRIGYNIWVGFGPLFVAQEKGLFAEEGLEVELINMSIPEALYAGLLAGVAFEDVLAVFASREAVTIEDRRRDYGESRYVVLCPSRRSSSMSHNTVRGGRIRLISARRASRREEREYERRRPDAGSADPGRSRPD
jgi:uncharacterized DUF497 family protein